MPGQPVVDVDVVLSRLNGNRAMLGVLVEFFLEDAPQILQRLHEGVNSSSFVEVTRAAHSLRGLASTFEPTMVVDLASEIELRGKNADPSLLAELVKSLDAEFTQLVQALKSLPKEIA